jgi:TRAP-type mannitol/chloroaromatic compound transport system permease large subunit
VDIVTDFINSLAMGKWGTYVMMMIVLLILGCLLDWVAIVLITFPIFLPLATQFGFDKLWFLVIIAVNLQASFLTPPFGYALFYLGGIVPEGVEMIHIYKGVVPFIVIIAVVIAVITIWPDVVLWLPSKIVS